MPIAFSIPNYPSFTSTTPNQMPILFIPNIRFLIKFTEGNLGIGKKMLTRMHLKALSQMKDVESVKVYLKNTGVRLPAEPETYFANGKNGKFNTPATIGMENKTVTNLGGLEALERSLIQSIFETQKQYIFIIKLVVDHFVILEDIVAHILGLAGRSLKPSGNPRALGYLGEQEGGGVQAGLGGLGAVIDKPGPKSKLSGENSEYTAENIAASSTPESATSYPPPPITFVTQSIVYSTGEFKEGINYTYIYKDILEEWFPNLGTQSLPEIDDDDDTGKEETLILGVYDSNWDILNLNNSKIDRYLDWVKPKYKYNTWPQLKPGQDFDYVYFAKILGVEKRNVGGPGTPTTVNIAGVDVGVDWQIKTYQDDDGPFLEVEGERKAIKKGQQMIALNSDKTRSILDFYKTFYLEYTEQKINETIGDGPSTYPDENGNQVDIKQSTINDVSSKLSDYSDEGNLVILLEGLLASNFMTVSGKPNSTKFLPDRDKFIKNSYAFKPKKNDNQVWLDIEQDYDMKIIRVSTTRNITFREATGEPERAAVIRRFLRRNFTLNASGQGKLGYFYKDRFLQGSTVEIYRNLDNITIDFTKVEGTTNDVFYIVETNKTHEIAEYENQAAFRIPIQVFISTPPANFVTDYHYDAMTKAEALTYKQTINNFTTDTPYTSTATYITIDSDDLDYLLYRKKRYIVEKVGDKYFLKKQIGQGIIQTDTDSITEFTESLRISNAISLDYKKLDKSWIEVPFSTQETTARTQLKIQLSNVNNTTSEIDVPNYFTIPYLGKTIILKNDYEFIGFLPTVTFNTPAENISSVNIFNTETETVTTTLLNNLPNLIRIDDLSTGTAQSRLISAINITNNQFRIPGPLAKGPYGSPTIGESDEDNAIQEVETIFRFQRYVDDVEDFYIVEAVLKSANENPLLTNAERNARQTNPNIKTKGRGGGGYYTWKSIFGVIPKFIRLVVRIATKLIPEIQSLINLVTNPAQFVSDIIVAKLGDDFGRDVPKFGFLSKEFMEQLTKAVGLITKLKETRKDLIRYNEAKKQLKQFLDVSILKNYVFISDEGVGKFVLDGTGAVYLFGSSPLLAKLPKITFGIQTRFSTLLSPEPKAPIKLIFSVDRKTSGSSKNISDILGNTADKLSKEITESSLYNSNLNPNAPLIIKNQLVTEAGGVQSIEEVSIQYSTGIFREDVKYEYFYITEEVKNLLEKADALISKGDNNSLSEAAKVLQDAKNLDPTNKLIDEKLDLLSQLKAEFFTNPLFDFILNFVMLPIKVVFGIIMYILNWFKSLSNPFKIPVKIIEFLTFAWIIEFFNPTSPNSMLAMSDILFDVQKFFKVWIPDIQLPKIPNLPNAPNVPNAPNPPILNGLQKFDMNDIIKLPWTTWPTFTREEFEQIYKFPLPVEILKIILCLIEAIINSFIDLIWSIFGLLDPESGRYIVVKPPYLNLCKDTNRELSVKDILNILNLTTPDIGPISTTESDVSKNPSLYDDGKEENSFNFIYDIKTSDGRSVLNLNQQELDRFMEENKDLLYTFNLEGP